MCRSGLSCSAGVVLVGGGEVGKDTLRFQMGQVTGPGNCLNAAVKVAAPDQKAQAAHAGIHLDVDLQTSTAERGGSIVFLCLGPGRDGHRSVFELGVASTGNGSETMEVLYYDESIWMTQKMIATLHDVTKQNIRQHIQKNLRR